MTSTALLREKVLAVLPDGAGYSPRGLHRIVGGRFESVQAVLIDLESRGEVTVKEGAGNRRVYTLVPPQELKAVRRGRRLLHAVREAGTLARSDAYRPADAHTAADLQAVIDRLVADGLVVEDPATRSLTAALDDNLGPEAAVILAAIRAAGEDGSLADQCDDALLAAGMGSEPRHLLGQLVLAGLIVAHDEGDFVWWVAPEHDHPHGPEAPGWGLFAKADVVIRRVVALGPQPSEALVAAALRAGIPEIRLGDLELVAKEVGFVEVNGLWRDDIRATQEQRRRRALCLEIAADLAAADAADSPKQGRAA